MISGMTRWLRRLRKRIPYKYWLFYDFVVVTFVGIAIVFDLIEFLDKRGSHD